MTVTKPPVAIPQTAEEILTELEKITVWMAKAKLQAEQLRHALKERLEKDMVITAGKEGAQTVEYTHNGVVGKLKVEQKINRTLNQKGVPVLQKKLEATTFAKLMKCKWEISVTAYRQLTPKELALVDTYLKVSPGLPTITFTKPAEEEAE